MTLDHQKYPSDGCSTSCCDGCRGSTDHAPRRTRATAEAIAWNTQMRAGRDSAFWRDAFAYDAVARDSPRREGSEPPRFHPSTQQTPVTERAGTGDSTADSTAAPETPRVLESVGDCLGADRQRRFPPSHEEMIAASSDPRTPLRVNVVDSEIDEGIPAMPPAPWSGDRGGIEGVIKSPGASGQLKVRRVGWEQKIWAGLGPHGKFDFLMHLRFSGATPGSWMEQEIDTFEWGILRSADGRSGGVTWRRTLIREIFRMDGKGNMATRGTALGLELVGNRDELRWHTISNATDHHSPGTLLLADCDLCTYVFYRECRLFDNVGLVNAPKSPDGTAPIFILLSRSTTGDGCLFTRGHKEARPDGDLDSGASTTRRGPPDLTYWFSAWWSVPCALTQMPGVPPPWDPSPPAKPRGPCTVGPRGDGVTYVDGSDNLLPSGKPGTGGFRLWPGLQSPLPRYPWYFPLGVPKSFGPVLLVARPPGWFCLSVRSPRSAPGRGVETTTGCADLRCAC